MLAQTQPTADSGVIFVIAIVILVAVLVLGMLWLKAGAKLRASNAAARAQRVKQTSHGAHPVMSRPLVSQSSASRIAQDAKEPLTAWQSFNAVNGQRSVNEASTAFEDDQEDTSAATEDEKSLRYDERLRTLADLINAGVARQAEGIEKAFHCTRSGRKDSKYEQVRADLLPLLKTKESAVSPIAGRPIGPKASFYSDNPDMQIPEPS